MVSFTLFSKPSSVRTVLGCGRCLCVWEECWRDVRWKMGGLEVGDTGDSWRWSGKWV